MGAIEELKSYGCTVCTRPGLLQQAILDLAARVDNHWLIIKDEQWRRTELEARVEALEKEHKILSDWEELVEKYVMRLMTERWELEGYHGTGIRSILRALIDEVQHV